MKLNKQQSSDNLIIIMSLEKNKCIFLIKNEDHMQSEIKKEGKGVLPMIIGHRVGRVH